MAEKSSANEQRSNEGPPRWHRLKLPGVQKHRLWTRLVSIHSLPVAAILEVRIAVATSPAHAVVLRYGLEQDPRVEKHPFDSGRQLPFFLEPLLRRELEFFKNAVLPAAMDDILVVNREGRVTAVLRFPPETPTPINEP